MGDKTGISWTDATWSPSRGCSRISAGCQRCYAERIAARFSDPGQPFHGFARRKLTIVNNEERDPGNKSEARWTGKVEFQPDQLAIPLRWKKPRRIFCSSMTDIFHESLSNEEIATVFGIMAACPQHIFQVLTKRAIRMHEWFEWMAADEQRSPQAVMHVEVGERLPDVVGRLNLRRGHDEFSSAAARAATRRWPLSNVWIGTSCENQDAADDRVPELLAIPAAVRFISAEPLLGPIDLRRVRPRRSLAAPALVALPPSMPIDSLTGGWGVSSNDDGHHRQEPRIHLVIAGCESGHGARPCDLEWIRALRDQCAVAGVAYFLKQAGDWRVPLPQRQGIMTAGDGSKCKPGGVIELPYLDGVQHAAFPEVIHG